jgi:hypothetical protein
MKESGESFDNDYDSDMLDNVRVTQHRAAENV